MVLLQLLLQLLELWKLLELLMQLWPWDERLLEQLMLQALPELVPEVQDVCTRCQKLLLQPQIVAEIVWTCSEFLVVLSTLPWILLEL